MKAILVIDMPTRCEDCIYAYSQGHGNHKCILDSKWKLGVPIEKRSVDCPLKPLPLRMKVDYDTISSAEVTDKVVAIGWNACLEEIEDD